MSATAVEAPADAVVQLPVAPPAGPPPDGRSGYAQGDRVYVFFRCAVPQRAPARPKVPPRIVSDSTNRMQFGSIVRARHDLQSANGWAMAQGEEGVVVSLDDEGDPFIRNEKGDVSPEAYYSSSFGFTGRRQLWESLDAWACVVALRKIESSGWVMQEGEHGVVVSLDADGDPYVRNQRGQMSPEAFYSTCFAATGEYASGDVCFSAFDTLSGSCTPRMGLTDGWVPAVVREDFDPAAYNPDRVADTGVKVHLENAGWYTRCGSPMSGGSVPGYSCGIAPHLVSVCRKRPSLSLVVFRWGGETRCDPVHDGAGGWGRTGSMVSDPYILQLFEETVYGSLQTDYESYTIFISNTDDLARVNSSTLTALLSGQHRASFFFLWPVNYQSSAEYSGYVGQQQLLNLMVEMEAAGVVTRFPHHSHLYRLLLSKDWMAHLSVDPSFCAPPTTKVSRSQVEVDPLGAARQAARVLRRLRAARGMPDREPQGVAKLGFAWEATDVRRFQGTEQLSDRLIDLATRAGITGMNGVLVQDWVDFSIEFRLFFIDPKPEWDVAAGAPKTIQPRAILYTRFNKMEGSSGCPVQFDRLTRERTLKECMSGDEAALADAERRCVELGSRALFWLQTECAEPPPVLRVDCMVRRDGPGTAAVALGELTELGGCFLGWEQGPRNVWGAVVRSCFRDAGGVPRLPPGARPPALPEQPEGDDR